VDSIAQPYGINAVGHQGLFHDEATGLVYNPARMLHLRFDSFMQRNLLGYVDGLNSYTIHYVSHIHRYYHSDCCIHGVL
jgi:hypothetical protein